MSRDIPTIDYGSHPAYVALGVTSRTDEAGIDALLDEIDSLYETTCFATHRSVQERQQDIDRVIVPKLTDLANRIVAHGGVNPQFAAYVELAIDTARNSLRDSVGARSTTLSNSDIRDLPEQILSRVNDFNRDGYCEFGAEGALAQKVWAHTVVERAVLRAKARRKPNVPTCAISLHPQSPASRAIEQTIKENRLLNIASAYMRKPMEVLYYALEYNQDRQAWYKNCYADVGLPTSRTAYMHFDADSDVLKAMLYLVDVNRQNGAFRYIPGSHLWKRSPSVCAIRNGFDQAQWKVFQWADSKLHYYRPRFMLAHDRPNTMALPARLRGSTHFGDDILDESPLSADLLQQERIFEGPAGTMVLFDGSQGIHRGGLVESGARWVIQIGLRVKIFESAPPSALKGRLSYLKHTTKSLLGLALGR